MLLVLAGAAWADDEIPASMTAVAEAVELGNAREYGKAIKTVEKVLKTEPSNTDARVARGVYRYHAGDAAGAQEDLALAFDDRVWEHRKVESKTGTDVTVTKTTLDTTELRTNGAAILVLLAVRADELDRAEALIAKARKAFGDAPQLAAVEARLWMAREEVDRAWTTLAAALTRPDPTGFTQSVASEVVALHPEGAPEPVTDWLRAAGQWSAHYNAAIGHLRQRDYPACVADVADGLAAFPDHPKMLDVGYPCAARVDLGRAGRWLDGLGGPRKAEPWSVLAHARSLQTNSRPDEALDLLAKLPKKLPGELPGQVETLVLDLLVKRGDLDGARKASTGDAPVAELNVGHALVQAKRLDDAVDYLETVCPRLQGQAAHGNCTQLLEYARASR